MMGNVESGHLCDRIPNIGLKPQNSDGKPSNILFNKFKILKNYEKTA